ncbi:uncharacterized protein BCR38DRAFT_451892 [Pseudomassariella vexata]|uniref:Calcineurin-like phosphoesterase domain-containing protein n=1 Tax=Pseudomassariella vexata TaxID=1141098 RepID=A0A1Y2D9N4_9PEZI|nr:uncharacterized protein BCR38DRAFT_451892 [Pseudomassariella vexata]ORY55927.1 hypothetical protein BCR38DRAFT_451892 [Pseudomassariella vexata]
MYVSPVGFVRHALRVLFPLALASTVYLYLYPIFLGCAFPLPADQTASVAFRSTIRQHANGGSPAADGIAPLRLLALGDPQLEGDTSIPNAHRESSFPHIKSMIAQFSEPWSLRERSKRATHELVDFYFEDIPDTLESIRKRIDLFGNDFYLAHIYRTLRWWTKPSHVTVLGDLLGSQWIDDEEFEKRSWRYWNRAFAGGERVPDEVAAYPSEQYDLAGYVGPLGKDAALWEKRIINIAGNHDVGYAGDLTVERLERFERVYGKAAYELRFELPITNATTNATLFDADQNPESVRLVPELRIVVINDMNLDTPACTPELQDKTYAFVNDLINTATAVEFKGHFTLALTHIPLHKPEGICVDAPFFDFHPSDQGGGVKEQFMLSADASKGFLEGLFGLNGDSNAPGNGMGRHGVILNGHDHEGCDTWHYINQTVDMPPDQRKWEVMRWGQAKNDKVPGKPGLPGLREITVRSMMGGFGGNAGLFSAWFDEEEWEWRYEYTTCALGKQTWWWAVHIIDLIAIIAVLIYGGLKAASAAGVDVEKWPSCIASKFSRAPVLSTSNGHVPGTKSDIRVEKKPVVYVGNGNAKRG